MESCVLQSWGHGEEELLAGTAATNRYGETPKLTLSIVPILGAKIGGTEDKALGSAASSFDFEADSNPSLSAGRRGCAICKSRSFGAWSARRTGEPCAVGRQRSPIRAKMDPNRHRFECPPTKSDQS